MTDKEKILAFLEGMSKGCCPKETKEIIINKIIPWINDLPKEPVSEDLEKEYDKYIENDGDEPLSKEYFLKLCQHFSNWQKQQILANAVDALCFGFQDAAALFYFRLPAKNYHVNSEVKVIVIKEE